MAQINTSFLPEQWIALKQLVTDVKKRICSMPKTEE